MLEYLKIWLELKTDRRAVTALEYGLIAGAIVDTGLAGFSALGTNLATKITSVSSAL